jgi:hypothetical protein
MSPDRPLCCRRRFVGALTGITMVILIAGTACASATGKRYAPNIDPAEFSTTIDNPYFPLTPGARWVYESETPEGLERIVVEVTDDTRQVMGVSTVVVHDTVTLDGAVIEDTFDWYAQDADGNVWYFGEDTREFENGVAVNTKGAWEAGIDGAQPGIVMQADPKVGDRYRQEYYKGEAEDEAKVLALHASVDVPFGEFDGVLKTRDFTRLEPTVVEQKFYAKGVGVVQEKKVRGGSQLTVLIEHTTRSKTCC